MDIKFFELIIVLLNNIAIHCTINKFRMDKLDKELSLDIIQTFT